MTAADHLGEQFMTHPEVANMHSGDFAGYRVGQLHSQQVRGKYYSYDWDRLHSELESGGMKRPLEVEHPKYGDPVLRNGHHRAVAGLDRGQMFFPTTEKFIRDEPDNNYRYTKKQTESSKPHPFVGNQRTPRPPQPRPEIPGQMSLL